MGQNLIALADELGLRFPGARPIAPVKVLGSGFEGFVIETASGIMFKVARGPEARERLELECSLLREVATRLPVRVPVPQWQAFDLAGAPHGIVGYRKLEGAPLDAAPLTGGRARTLGVQIGGFLAALHAVKPTELEAALPTFDPHRLLKPALVAATRDALAPHATEDELLALDNWFARARERFSCDSDRFVLTHGDLWYENLLAAPGPRLTGVLDWSNSALSHRSRDFAPLIYTGSEFLDAVAHAYAEATGHEPGELLAQAPAFLTLRELLGLQWAQKHDSGEVPDAIGKVISLLRRGLLQEAP
jgi:aminoglycoside 2''-phosphotransferase